MQYALIKDGVVENVIVWDGKGDMFSKYMVVEVNNDNPCGPGWSYDGEVFIPPPEQEVISISS